MASNDTTKRLLGLDILRILATIAVIVIHISAPIMTTQTIYLESDLFWWFSNVLDSLSRFSVPAFVVFSGYSFSILIKKPDFVKKSKYKLFRLAKITMFWSLFFIVYRIIKGDFDEVSNVLDVFILALVKPLLAGLPYFHLWYLYMALGLFFISIYLVPFLKDVTNEKIISLLCLASGFSLLFSFQNYYYDNKLLFIFWFFEYMFYFMFGFFISNIKVRLNVALSLFGFFFVVLVNCFLVYFMIGVYGADRGQYFYEFVSPFVMLQTLFIFNLFKRISMRSPKLVVLLSKLSLAVYLIHPIITENIVPYVRESHSILGMIVAIVFSVVISFLISFLLYTIPGVKKIAV